MKLARNCRRAFLLIIMIACAISPLAARAEIAPSEMKDDGVVRVKLRSLGEPVELTLTLDGSYTLGGDAGFRFARGTQIRLRNIGGEIWMNAGALALNLGKEATLTRNAVEGDVENGIRIVGAKLARNLYPGDLRITAENGALRAVLSIQMEDYLRGVIAYEMSNDWPVEALKAQAVAARTYAMRAKANSKKRDYDLVDTPSDQVFRGVDASLKHVAEAVEATRGVVGTYEGEFAGCYYTASNGGETALPEDVWEGEANRGYLARRADPYDLENARSKVASVSFKKDASDLPALRKMLEEALAEQPGAERAELESIEAIEPVEPIAEGSTVCTKLKFTLRAAVPTDVLGPGEGDVGAPAEATTSESGNLALYALDYLRRLLLGSPFEPTGEEEDVLREFDVELDVYEQIKDGLGLGLNDSDCEVVSVSEAKDGYTIELRRFGHGVGMSQRGAQTMAGAHGMNFEQILVFYYPGMTLERIDWSAQERAPLEDLPEEFGFDLSTPLPEPKPGEYRARVTLADASSRMNLRQSPSTDAAIVATLRHGEEVLVQGEPDENGWVHVRTAKSEGYAKEEYLERE